MSDVKFTVGGAMEDDASRRFIDAWHRAERGESFHERHLAFESWDALARVLTGKRMELLRYVRRHNVTSIRALAKALSRDYSNVHADVQALAGAGLLDNSGKGVRRLRCHRNKDCNLRARAMNDGELPGLGIGSWALDIQPPAIVGDGMERMNIISNNIAFIESLLRHSFQTQKFRSRHLGQMGKSSKWSRKHNQCFFVFQMNTSATA